MAVVMTTAIVPLIFQPSLRYDPRIKTIRTLSRSWGALNFLFGLAVINRMRIYIDDNGLTRMRIIGLRGIVCVRVGLVLVNYKIRKQPSFGWLMEAQVWTFQATIYLAALTPMNPIAHTYNTHQILTGQFAFVVQITYHDMSDEGWIAASCLRDTEHSIIREGLAATMVQREQNAIHTNDRTPS